MPLDVVQVEQLGTETILHCRTKAAEPVVIAQYGQAPIEAGEELHLDTAATPFLVFAADGKQIAAP